MNDLTGSARKQKGLKLKEYIGHGGKTIGKEEEKNRMTFLDLLKSNNDKFNWPSNFKRIKDSTGGAARSPEFQPHMVQKLEEQMRIPFLPFSSSARHRTSWADAIAPNFLRAS